MRWAVLLAGGSGSRFWPLSTPAHPKQLLPLAGPRSTAQEALDRLAGLIEPDHVLVVTGEALARPLREALDLPAANILVEPRAASTGPALLWATLEAHRRDPDAEVLSLHADWTIGDAEGFRRTAALALESARRHDRLVTVGMVPARPETGYGYIVPGPELDQTARRVARFVEKPDAARALDLIAAGALWNSGLFAWTAERLRAEVVRHTPELSTALAALEAGDVPRFFASVTPISIDVGVLERSNAVAVVSGAFRWDDVGTWEALARVRQRDDAGNVFVGGVHSLRTSDCIAWSDDEPILLFGVRDLVVVRANGRILVMSRAEAAHLKEALDVLPPEVRDV